jgi:hypothetical protein
VKIKILKEAGYDEALLGLSLSYNSEPSKRVADRLAFKGNGESKFLESIDVWLDVTAPLYWWKQADTYRISTKQSESTMHTIMRQMLTLDDFEYDLSLGTLGNLNDMIYNNDFVRLNNELPQGYLQRRVWKLPYNVLQNIVRQRGMHKLPEWQLFIESLYNLEHPEWIFPVRLEP